MLKETLKNIAKTQRKEILKKEKLISRDESAELRPRKKFAIIISGIRRCGKSTLLKQMIEKQDNFYYFNFEDPRVLDFKVEDFQKLNEIFSEEFGKSDLYFFDEIQNVDKWEIPVRSLLDKNNKVIITGSNSSLLSKELGTKLTGRHLTHELFPFSFREFLSFKKEEPSLKKFDKYLQSGGFPEYLKIQKEEILQHLFLDVISRDIVTRYGLRESKTIRELALFLITNIGKEFSFNSLKKTFNLGSSNTIKSFIGYLEDSYLIFTIPKFSYSLKKQAVNPKKVYSIDNGSVNANSASFSPDKGKLLENLVFLNLRKNNKEIFYFQGDGECDFVVKEGTSIVKAVQSCYKVTEDNKDRELNGLLEAMEKFDLDEGTIITRDQKDILDINNRKIYLKPAHEWLLD